MKTKKRYFILMNYESNDDSREWWMIQQPIHNTINEQNHCNTWRTNEWMNELMNEWFTDPFIHLNIKMKSHYVNHILQKLLLFTYSRMNIYHTRIIFQIVFCLTHAYTPLWGISAYCLVTHIFWHSEKKHFILRYNTYRQKNVCKLNHTLHRQKTWMNEG